MSSTLNPTLIDFPPGFLEIIFHRIKTFQTINNLEQSWLRAIPLLHIGAYKVILGEELNIFLNGFGICLKFFC